MVNELSSILYFQAAGNEWYWIKEVWLGLLFTFCVLSRLFQINTKATAAITIMEINIHNQEDELPFFACTCISAMIKSFWLNNRSSIIIKHKLCLHWSMLWRVLFSRNFNHNYEYERFLKHKMRNEVIKNLISTFSHISIFLQPSNGRIIVRTPG